MVQQLPVSALNVLWQRAGSTYGIPWQVLASINKIESNFGQNMGPSSAGAVGWMQFMPSTWLRWGVDADGDGVADPWNASDAIFAAARYLAAAGGQVDIARGVFAYNHADWYVREVLDLAQVYGQGGITQTVDLQQLQAKLDDARRAVVSASEKLQAAQAREQQLRGVSSQRCTAGPGPRHCSRTVWLPSTGQCSSTSASTRPARQPLRLVRALQAGAGLHSRRRRKAPRLRHSHPA